MSSMRKRKIVRIARDGSVSDFVQSGRDGLFSVAALAAALADVPQTVP